MSKRVIVIEIDNVLISDDVIEKHFVCDLSRCKGGCCEEGDAGAPLEKDELLTIGKVFNKIRPYLTEEAIAEIERKGKYEFNTNFGWVTTTLPSDHEICVYGSRDKDGVIKCAFEQAYNDGVITWKKPLSCHLYPVVARRGKPGNHDNLNYSPREKLCSPACALGEQLKVPAYKFLKEPLIRKYGREFYETLDQIAKEFFNKKEQINS